MRNFWHERGGTQSILYCSMRAIAEGGMLMLRFINYQNIVSVNFDHAQKFQNYVQMSETSAKAEALEAVGGAGEKLDWDLLFILPDGHLTRDWIIPELKVVIWLYLIEI